MAILVDFSGTAISAIIAVADQFKHANKDEYTDICRHVILNSLRSYNVKFKKEYGQIVICLDGRSNWRKKVFPAYKCRRGTNKDKDNMGINWDWIFDILAQIKGELAEHFPWKVVVEEGAEGDDVMAAIAKYLQTNELKEELLDSYPQPTLIISKDKDMIQCALMPHVRVWNPYKKEYVDEIDVNAWLAEFIVRGDGGDDVPNIFSPDNSFKDGIRQKAVKSSRIPDFVAKGRAACENDDEFHGWDRNNLLLNFANMPEVLREQIINAYTAYTPKGNIQTIYNYLLAYRCNQLITNIDDFK